MFNEKFLGWFGWLCGFNYVHNWNILNLKLCAIAFCWHFVWPSKFWSQSWWRTNACGRARTDPNSARHSKVVASTKTSGRSSKSIQHFLRMNIQYHPVKYPPSPPNSSRRKVTLMMRTVWRAHVPTKSRRVVMIPSIIPYFDTRPSKSI